MKQEKLFFLQRKNKARPHNRFCSGIDTSTKRQDFVSAFLPYLSSIYNACAVLYYHLCPVWLYHIIPYYPINGTNFHEEISKKILF